MIRRRQGLRHSKIAEIRPAGSPFIEHLLSGVDWKKVEFHESDFR